MAATTVDWNGIAALIREGVEKTASAVEEKTEEKEFAEGYRKNLPFLDKIDEWIEKLPPEKIRTSMFSFLKKLETELLASVTAKKIQPGVYGATAEHPSPEFVEQVIIAIGPEIVVSPDKMKVHIAIDKEYAHAWDAEKIIAGLERLGIQGTIRHKEIEKALENPGKSFKIVDGNAPIPGKDAAIEDCLGLDLDGIPSVIDRNRVDLKSLNWIHNISENQVILKKEPATPGVPGMDVFAEEIPCRDGVDIPFPSVTNTILSEDGFSLLSSVNGCAYKEGDSLTVVEALDINSNVDYATGHITADVSVNIAGDVLTGFRVESKDDIHVKGTVEGSRLNAKGNIFLPGGVQGKTEAIITSEKHIEAKFINAATVVAKGDITVHGSIIQSKLRARRVHSLEKSAEIIGGIIEAEEDICADTIGSEIGVKTLIRLGHDIPELKSKIEKIKEQIKQYDLKNKQCDDNLEKLVKVKKQTGTLSSTQVKLKEKLLANKKKIEEVSGTKIRQLELNEELLEKANTLERMVRVKSNILPGAEVTIIEHSFAPKVPTGPITLKIMADGIEELPFEEREFESDEEVEE